MVPGAAASAKSKREDWRSAPPGGRAAWTTPKSWVRNPRSQIPAPSCARGILLRQSVQHAMRFPSGSKCQATKILRSSCWCIADASASAAPTQNIPPGPTERVAWGARFSLLPRCGKFISHAPHQKGCRTVTPRARKTSFDGLRLGRSHVCTLSAHLVGFAWIPFFPGEKQSTLSCTSSSRGAAPHHQLPSHMNGSCHICHREDRGSQKAHIALLKTAQIPRKLQVLPWLLFLSLSENAWTILLLKVSLLGVGWCKICASVFLEQAQVSMKNQTISWCVQTISSHSSTSPGI